MRLNSSDSLYAEIRDMNFQAVPAVLSRQAKKISAAYAVSNSIDSAMAYNYIINLVYYFGLGTT